MNSVKSFVLCISLLITNLMSMDPPAQPVPSVQLPKKMLVEHIYEVRSKNSGIPCYLMGTQHVNGNVSDRIVKFATDNLSQIYFEKHYQYDFDDIIAPFFAQVYFDTSYNREKGIFFSLPEGHGDDIKDSISLLRKSIDRIHTCMDDGASSEEKCHLYIKNAETANAKAREKQNNLIKMNIEMEKRINSSENPDAMRTYLGLTMHEKHMAELGEKFSEGDKQNVNMLMAYFRGEVSEEDYKKFIDELDRTTLEKETLFAKTLLPHINPIDILTLALYSKCQTFLMKFYQAAHEEGDKVDTGVEDQLRLKVGTINPDFCFNELESDYTRLMGLKTMMLKHTDMSDPYGQWNKALLLLDGDVSEQDGNAIFGEPGTAGTILPQFLIDVLNGTLGAERENRWLDPIRNSMVSPLTAKGSLFAFGNDHISHLVDRLTQEGHTVTKVDLAD